MGTDRARRNTSRRFWGLAIVGLLVALVALVVPVSKAWATPGVPNAVAVTLSPSSIRADGGTSTSTATATVTDSNGAPVPLATVNWGTNGDVKFSGSSGTTGPDGKASTTIQSSSTPDVETISATSGGHIGTAQLTEFSAATSITVAVVPASIPADGSSTSTATATVKDTHGFGVADENVSITTNGDATVGSVTNHGDGTYTATITASKTADTETITAKAAKANLTNTTSLTETPGAATSVALTLTQPSIVADGAATSTADALVKDTNGNPVTNETVTITTNGDAKVSAVTNQNNGHYTATITASKTADQETITATATKANKTNTATLTETPGNPTSVTVVLNPSTIPADGTSTSTATATVKDANGNLVKDEIVTFSSNDPNNGIGATTNNQDGTYKATIKASGTAGPKTITATTSKHANVSGNATLTQFAAANSTTLVLTPDLIPADGAAHSTATATVTDSQGNPVAGAPVGFATNGDATFSQTTVNTGADGKASTQITASHTADKETITANGGGHTGNATLTEFGPATTVTLVLTPSSLTADGTSTSTATATVKDANGNPVPNETVTMSRSGDVTIGAVTNKGDGTYTANITASKTADVETITATATKANKAGTAQLTENPGATATVTVVLTPASIVANGSSTSTATATAKDANGNLVKTDAMSFGTSGDATIGAPTNNQDGTYKATITSSKTADQETITATDTTVNKSGTATLTETAGPATSVALGLNPPSLTADGSSTSTATATVKDANNNPVTNETVTMTKSGDVTIGAVTGHPDGTYTATITASKTADVETITATATKANKSGTAQLTENPGPPVLGLTLTPNSIPADGVSTSTATASVKDANGNAYPSETVTIVTDGDAKVSAVTNHNDGTYTATITASNTADQETIKADDAAKSLTKTATLTETPAATGFHSLPPTRILDTRGSAAGPLQPNSQRTVPVAGHGGVPATHVSAVVLNLTATQPSTQTFLTVFPSGSPPNASNLNVAAGRDAANLVTAQLAQDGSVQLYNAAGTVHAIFDVVGYYDDGSVAGAPHYTALNPARVLDTRTNGGPVGPNQSRTVAITGHGGVPVTHVTGVVVNVTGVQPTAGTFLTVYPSGTTPPTASNINLLPGEIRPNLVMVPVAADGSVKVYNAQGNTNVIFDVTGYFDDGTVGGKGFTSHAPARILDTRNGFPLGQGQSKTVAVAGQGGVPSTGVTAVVINVTATRATNGTFLTVYPQSPRPTVSNLNVPPATDIPNLVVATLAPDGTVQLYNDQGSVDAIFDVVGWFS